MKRHTKLDNWLKFVQQWIYPPLCSLCGAPGHDQRDLCLPCRRGLPYNHNPCRQCGLPLQGSESLFCGRCLKKSPPFDRAIIPFLYHPPLDQLLLALKFHQGLAHARLLGELLADAVATSDSHPQLIIPVPLHPQRLRERGYNQALEIARLVAKRIDAPLSIDSALRMRATESQTRLKYKTRHKNVRGAFAVNRVVPKHVAIVDDVMTSGSTMSELAKALKKNGAETVEIWAIARAHVNNA